MFTRIVDNIRNKILRIFIPEQVTTLKFSQRGWHEIDEGYQAAGYGEDKTQILMLV